jgi:plastocyanin
MIRPLISRGRSRPARLLPAFASIAGMVVFLAACGSDTDNRSTSNPPPTPAAAAAAVTAEPVGAAQPRGATPAEPMSTPEPAPAAASPTPSPSPSPAPPAASPSAPAGARVDVRIAGFAFGPAMIQVAPGAPVTWTNADAAPHTTTGEDGAWDSGTLAPGASFSVTFSTPGTYEYACTIHPFMRGTVVVGG